MADNQVKKQAKTPRKRSNYQRGIGYILFTAGVILTVSLGSSVVRGYDTYSWPQSTALIYKATMKQTTQLGEQALYQPDVSYRYQVNGETFEGQNLYRSDIPFNPERELGRQLDEFSVGAIRPIYINPELPSEAVLIQGVQSQFLVGLVFAIACFAIGLSSLRQR